MNPNIRQENADNNNDRRKILMISRQHCQPKKLITKKDREEKPSINRKFLAITVAVILTGLIVGIVICLPSKKNMRSEAITTFYQQAI